MAGGDEWWSDQTGDYNPTQTGETALGQEQQVDQNTTYTPPGQIAPADQWNFTPDPNAPGGYQAVAPGSVAPLDQAQFSNATGQYPNDQSMSHAISNQSAGQYTTGVDAQGNAVMGGQAGMPGMPQIAPGGSLGYVNWGQTPVAITPMNTAVLGNPQLQQQMAPGYIPGSGAYNQYNLGQGNLFGGIGPNNVLSNLNFGVGGPGDPTHGAQAGLEAQTPDQIVQGPHLFDSMVGNIGTRHNNGTEGLDYIPTLFARGDTPSGISTVAFGAPQQYWDGLYQAIGRGIIRPTAAGWQFLASRGVTPQTVGGQAPALAQAVGYGAASGQGGPATYTNYGLHPGGVQPGQVAPGPGTPTGGATGPMGPGTQAFNPLAAQADLANATLNRLSIPQMQNQTALGYLQQLANLRGPADIFQYLRVLGGTPQGIRDIVNASAGAYRMPATGAVGQGGTSGPASIESVLAQMNNPNYGQEAQGLTLPPPNQLSAQNLLRMGPAQIQTLLAAYEAQGWRPEDVLSIFRNSMPQYATNQQPGRVALFGQEVAVVDGYGLAGLPDVSDDDWNAYTADQFSAAIDPLQESLRFQEMTSGVYDEVARAAQPTPAMPMGQGINPGVTGGYSAPDPYQDLRSQMMAPDTNEVQIGNGMPPLGPQQMGPPGLNAPGGPIGPSGPPQSGLWEGTDPSKPNLFSWAGEQAQQGAEALRSSGFTQTPVIGGALGGATQYAADALRNLGGTSQALRQGNVLGAAGGLLQATVGEQTPLGIGKSMATEAQWPTQILPGIDPETPVLGGLNNPRELAGLVPQLVAPETYLERAVGHGVVAPALRAAGRAAEPITRPIGEAVQQGYGALRESMIGGGDEMLGREAGMRAEGVRASPGRALSQEAAEQQVPINEPLPIGVYFSRLGRAIEELPQEKMTLEQAKNGLLKKGVKAEELRWTGLEDFLNGVDTGAPIGAPAITRPLTSPTTKTELRGLFEQGRVELREAVHERTPGSPEYERARFQADLANRRHEEARAAHAEMNARFRAATTQEEKDAIWQEGMGLLAKATEANRERIRARDYLQGLPTPEQDPMAPVPRYPEYVQLTEKQKADWDSGMLTQEQVTQPGYREIVISPQGSQIGTARPFKTTHFPASDNPVVHARVTDRTTPDGRRMLHVEELQSDWHEQGRRLGYRPRPEEIQAQIQEARPHVKVYQQIDDELQQFVQNTLPDRDALISSMEEATRMGQPPNPEAVARLQELNKQRRDLTSDVSGAIEQIRVWAGDNAMRRAAAAAAEVDVMTEAAQDLTRQADTASRLYGPNDPRALSLGRRANYMRSRAANADNHFRELTSDMGEMIQQGPFQQTQKWSELAMKRLLRMASEEGYDGLSFTPAAVHGKRYGGQMEQNFTRIEYDPSMQHLVMAFRNGQFHEVPNVPPSELPGYIGQGPADAIMARDYEPSQYLRNSDNTDFETVLAMSGQDLGQAFTTSEGFNLQYDKVMPQAVANILKPWKARSYMGEIELQPFGERSAAHIVDITPEMRQGINEEGFPVFMAQRGQRQQPGVPQAQNPITDNGQWPPEWGPQPPTPQTPGAQRTVPPTPDYWKRQQANTLFNRAATEFGGGALAGGLGGVYASRDEPDPAKRGAIIGGAMLAGGAGAFGVLHSSNKMLIDLLNDWATSGRMSMEYMQTHPLDLHRVQAVMRAAAESTADGDIVEVPPILTAMQKSFATSMNPEANGLISGMLTKEELLDRIGPGDPTRESHGLKQTVVDFLRALPYGPERMDEFNADATSLRGFENDPAMLGQAQGRLTGPTIKGLAEGIAGALGLPPGAFTARFDGGFRTDPPDIGFDFAPGRGGRKPILFYNQAFLDAPLSAEEKIAIMAHEVGHLSSELQRNARGRYYKAFGDVGDTGRRAGMAQEPPEVPEVPPDLTPDENPLPSAEQAGDVLTRVLNEMTPEGRAQAQEVGELGAQRAPWLGQAVGATDQPPPTGGSRYDDIMAIADPEATPSGGAVGDAMDAADEGYTPPHKFDKAERERLGNARILAGLPEEQRAMGEQAQAAMQQQLMQAHGFRSEADAKAAAQRIIPYMLQFAREAKPNEPVNEVLLRAGRDAWAQSIFPAYFADIDLWKAMNDPDVTGDPSVMGALQQSADYWAAARNVLGRYAGEIAPSEAGRAFRAMRDLPHPTMPGIAGGSGEVAEEAAVAAGAVNRAAKTPREKAYEDMMRTFRTARRGETQVQTAGETAARRGQARVAGKKPNGPLSQMGIEWADVLRRTGNDDADRMKLLAGLEELGGYRMRRDWVDRAMKLDLGDGKAVDDFWTAARKAAGVDDQLRPFVKFDPNISGQSYLGGADALTKDQALSMVSKELIKDADEAHAAARQARDSRAPARVIEETTRRAEAAFNRLGLKIENWNPDNMAILAKAAESVRDRIAKEWPADRTAGSGATEAVEKKRQLLGIFDQEIKKEQKLAGVPVTGIQDILSFGTSNVLTTARFVQASILESALSSVNEPLQSFLRGRWGEGMQQLRGLGRAFGLPSSGDLQALGEGVKAPAIANALRGVGDVGPMQAAGELRDVAKEGAGRIMSDSPNLWGKIISPMHRVSRGISEAFQTGNYFAEVNRLAHQTAETGLLPGGRRIEPFVDDATGQSRNPSVRELFGNLPQEIVDAALKKSRFVNEGGDPGWIEKQVGQWKALLNKPNATATERTQGLFANLMFPFVYGLRPAISAGGKTLFSAGYHGSDLVKALKAGDTEEAKYAAKKLVLANSFNGFIAYQAMSGNITGHGPTDTATRQALMEQTDEHGDPIWRPDSYRIPNPGGGHTWVKYTSLPGPVSIVSTVMANMYEAYAYDGKDMEVPSEIAARMATRVMPSYFDNTYFRDMISLAEAFNSNSGPQEIARIGGQIAGRFVPAAGALRTAATVTDPYQRITSNLGEDLMSGVPGLRQRLPAQVSGYTGKPVEQPLNPLTAAGGLAGNIYASPSERNPMAAETADLSRRRLPWDNAEGLAGQRPSEGVEGMFPQTFTRGEQSRGAEFAGMRQTGEGIRGAQAAYGREAGGDLLSLLNSPAYQALSPQQKAQRISQEMERSSGQAQYSAYGAPGIQLPPDRALDRRMLQTPQYYGVAGSPDQIAQQNQEISAARNAMAQLATRFGRERAMALMARENPEAFRLAMVYHPMNEDALWFLEQRYSQELGVQPDQEGVFVPDFGSGSDVLGGVAAGGTAVGGGMFDRRTIPPSVRR